MGVSPRVPRSSGRLRFGATVRRCGSAGRRQRALLALLLCNANRVVSRDRLVDELLGDQPADSAPSGCSACRSRGCVRRSRPTATSTAAGRRAPGYMLRVEEGELDLQAFESSVSPMAGRRSSMAILSRPRCCCARRSRCGAAGRWPISSSSRSRGSRSSGSRSCACYAIEERIDAELALGRHAALCPELEALAAEHPLRERLRGQLMLALYRSGRQADALEAYRAGRSLLVEELALEPGPRLRQLEQAILEQDAGARAAREPRGRTGRRSAVAAPSRRSRLRTAWPDTATPLDRSPSPSGPVGCADAR